MNKIVIGFATAVILLGSAEVASAQGMMGGYGSAAAPSATSSSSSDTGDAVGAALLTKLQSGQTSCGQLTTQDFAALGDYYMGNMMGSYHDQADAYMTQSLGEQGDEQMHIAMGERLSGCNSSAAYPSGVFGFGPMMGGFGQGGWGMTNGWNAGGYPMMGFGSDRFGYSTFGGIVMALVWFFAIIGVVVSVRWLVRRAKK